MRLSTNILTALLLTAVGANGQDSGKANVCESPTPLSETGLRFPWEAEPENSPFCQGSTVGFVYASRIIGLGSKSNANMWSATVGGGYYFADNLSVNLSFNGMYGDHLSSKRGVDQGDFWGVSADLTLRYHFLNYGTWSVYLDGGVGVAELNKAVPFEGTRSNMNPMLGIGLTKQICECTMLMAGCRWYHLSNGSFLDLTGGSFFNGSRPNPGYDSKQIYAGLMFKY